MKLLFGTNIFCLNETNCIKFKQSFSLNQRKSFKQIIFFKSTNILLWVSAVYYSFLHEVMIQLVL